jgi:polyhydroxybutyrate depolymerase
VAIASQGWGKTLTVVAGIAVVVAAGAGALMIAGGRDDDRPTAGPGDGSGPRASASSTTAPPLPGTDVLAVLSSGGLERRYVVHVPGSYDGTLPVAVVLVLHGLGGDANEAARISGMSVKSDAEGFLAVYPEGSGAVMAFNAGQCCGGAAARHVDDVSFLRDVVADVSTNYAVDPQRIYAAGMSNGAMMAYRLGCEMSDVLAAIASVAGALEIDCAPAQPVSAIVFHGTGDAIVPYNGGRVVNPPGGMDPDYDPVSTAIGQWATIGGCTGATEQQVSANVTRQVQTGCLDGHDVELYTVIDGGHAWPGGQPRRTGGDVPTTEVVATDLIWDFFAAHPKP